MRVAVVGAGVMGPGIAQVFLMGGHEVVLTDVSAEALAEGMKRLGESVSLMHSEGLLQETPAAVMARARAVSSLAQAVDGAQLVVEAVPERPDIKQGVYAQLDRTCAPEAVIASNTSAFPLPVMFPDFRPGRFLVAHFFNPAHIVPLVEVVRHEKADPEVVAWLKGVLETCGKRPIILNGFRAGFLVNRLQTALMREALSLVESGMVSPEDLDMATMAAIGFKSAWQGTFDTMDYIGLDTVAMACAGIFPDLSNATDLPAVIGEKVRQGQLGVKTGRGFRSYEGKQDEALRRQQRLLLEQLKLWNKQMASSDEHSGRQ